MNNLARRNFMGGGVKADPTQSFIITVSVSAGGTFTLPLISNGTYNFVADWGDGTSDAITAYNQAEITHTYSVAGSYDIDMNGVIEGWGFSNGGDKLKITLVKQWGGENGVKFFFVSGVFHGCSNLDVTATDIPNLSLLTNFQSFFESCVNLVGNSSFNNWNVSSMTSMLQSFRNCSSFNQDLSNWDVSNVTNFQRTFGGDGAAMIFNNGGNPNINNWNVSSATNMFGMFQNCSFNQPINSWNVSSVTNFGSTFQQSTFNQDLSGWNTISATSMSFMFNQTPFNQNISTWNTSSVTNMSGMFQQSSFNQPIGNWDVSNVTNMQTMFWFATNFNQNLSAWDVSKVTGFLRCFNSSSFNNGGDAGINNWNMSSAQDLRQMFLGTPFNQPVNGWITTGSFTTINRMFASCPNFNQPVDNWNVSNVTDFGYVFAGATVFNQPLANWNTANMQTTVFMFQNAIAFNQNLGSWNVTALTQADLMFTGATLSTANYDALLTGWEAQLVQNNVTFNGGNSQYTAGSAAATARQNLITDHLWSITDGGAI